MERLPAAASLFDRDSRAAERARQLLAAFDEHGIVAASGNPKDERWYSDEPPPPPQVASLPDEQGLSSRSMSSMNSDQIEELREMISDLLRESHDEVADTSQTLCENVTPKGPVPRLPSQDTGGGRLRTVVDDGRGKSASSGINGVRRRHRASSDPARAAADESFLAKVQRQLLLHTDRDDEPAIPISDVFHLMNEIECRLRRRRWASVPCPRTPPRSPEPTRVGTADIPSDTPPASLTNGLGSSALGMSPESPNLPASEVQEWTTLWS